MISHQPLQEWADLDAESRTLTVAMRPVKEAIRAIEGQLADWQLENKARRWLSSSHETGKRFEATASVDSKKLDHRSKALSGRTITRAVANESFFVVAGQLCSTLVDEEAAPAMAAELTEAVFAAHQESPRAFIHRAATSCAQMSIWSELKPVCETEESLFEREAETNMVEPNCGEHRIDWPLLMVLKDRLKRCAQRQREIKHKKQQLETGVISHLERDANSGAALGLSVRRTTGHLRFTHASVARATCAFLMGKSNDQSQACADKVSGLSEVLAAHLVSLSEEKREKRKRASVDERHQKRGKWV